MDNASSITLSGPLPPPRFLKHAERNIKSGWLSLIPVEKKTSLRKIKFPINNSYKLKIGGGTNNDLILPPTSEVVPDVIIYFDEKYVFIENVSKSQSSENSFKIDNEIFRLKRKLAISIFDKDFTVQQLQFGPPNYVYNLIRCSALNTKYHQKVGNITKCVKCAKPSKPDVSPLPCGHMLCSTCLEELTNKAYDRANIVFEQQVLFGNVEVLNLDPDELECPLCLQSISISGLRDESVLNSLAQCVLDFKRYYNTACADCDNNRYPLMKSHDYWYCKSCNRYICPLCALNSHRNHEPMFFGYTEMQKRRNKYYYGDSVLVNLRYKNILAPRLLFTFDQITRSLAVLDECAILIQKSKRAIENSVETAKLLYARLVSLENRNDEDIETERTENLKLFRVIVETLYESLEMQIKGLQMKRNALLKIKHHFPWENIQTKRTTKRTQTISM